MKIYNQLIINYLNTKI